MDENEAKSKVTLIVAITVSIFVILSLVGTFVLVEALQVDRVFVGSIPLGGGWVEIAHGRMAVPAPATVALLTGYEAVGGPEA